MLRQGLAIAITGLVVGGSVAGQTSRPTPPRAGGGLAPPPTFRPKELELFSRDALEQLGPRPTRRVSSLVSGSPAAGNAAPAEASPSRPPAEPTSALASAETLETEVKAASAALTAAVKSPVEFRGRGYQSARRELTILAVCFEAIAAHPGSVRWQDQASGAALYFLAAADACRAHDDAGLRAAREAASRLSELLRGDSVELTGPGGASPDFAALMQRLETAHRDRLAPWTATAAEAAAHRDAILHEAEIVGLLARSIAAPGYEYSEDAGYRRHAESLAAAGAAVRQACDAPEPALSAAVGALGQSCDRCHADFRG